MFKRTEIAAPAYCNGAGMDVVDPGFRPVGLLALQAVFAMPVRMRKALLFGNSSVCLPLQKLLVRLLGGKFLVRTKFTEGPMRGRSFVCWSSEAYFMLGSHYESDAQRILMGILRPGDTVYDIGGHAGYMALLFSALVGPIGRVFTFEPSPVNFPRVQANIEANGPSNITAVNVAASDHEGVALIDERSSESKIVGTNDDSDHRFSRIQTMRLDDFAFRDGNPVPTFLKIDIEGHAGLALEGMRQILEVARPKIICELHNTDEEEHVTRLSHTYRYQLSSIDLEHSLPRRVMILPE
ncbi:MAG: FkbM family methyltransferase [Candidatus Binataceae bacterium]